MPRQPAQTPFEYEETLDTGIPDAAEPLSELTQAFIVARYSKHETTKTDVKQARNLWRTLRTAIRALQNVQPSGEERGEHV